jgi:hypothetical protein
MLTMVFLSFIFLLIIYKRLDHDKKEISFIKKFIIVFTPLFSGIIIFGIFPFFYRIFFDFCLESGMAETGLSQYMLFPLKGISKIYWGLLLFIIWFALQPIIIQFIFLRNNRKLLMWPLYFFLILISLWLTLAMLKPLIAIQ